MALQLRKPTEAELNSRETTFYAKTATGEGYVSILQAIGYTKSSVKVHNPIKGQVGIPIDNDRSLVFNHELFIAEITEG